jgi:hypothetical protein
MIKNKTKYLLTAVLAFMIAFTGCIGDLDTLPLDKDVVTSEDVYKNPANYKMVLAKLYAGLALSGQQGPAGMGDISGLDEGFGQYLRGYFYHQQLPTDEAVIGWNDATLRDFHDMDWTSTDGFTAAFYYRVFYQISAANEFIRETTPEKLSERGIAETQEIKEFRAEARFLRALSYWHAIDIFGTVPFVTENDKVGAFFPQQISRTDLFNYLESELLEIEGMLKDARANEYARADKAAAWMLLAKLYLNAQVYTGQAKNTEAITYLNKVIAAGYTLEPNYEHNFMADNHKSKEFIFPIVFDGMKAQTWGGTTFIVQASIGGNMDRTAAGVPGGGWGGLRVTREFVGKFYNLDLLKSATIPLKSAASYPVIYAPGGYQKAGGYGADDWTPATAAQLASVSSDDRYEGYIYFQGSAEFKFTAGPNWDLNWGDDGANGTLDQNGANISVEPGFYKVNVDLNTMTYSMLKTTWGMIGSATPNNWDNDTEMTFDPASKEWTAIVELKQGEIKFRANGGWDINLGDDGANGTLEYNGANIAIAEAGKYEVRVKIGTPDYTYTISKYSTDGRALFHTSGQTLEVVDLFEFTNGYAVTKWKNVTSTGQAGSHPTHVDTDFPVFRLADAYLMYAEAVLRGGSGGNRGTALQYINSLRQRAYGDNGGNITDAELTLDFILDERARELYWECHRRTDLIRFNKFTGGAYLWEWKGAVKDGRAVDAKYNLFPIPASDVGANPNLTQHPGF